jgi:transcriptional regulator with XRE-family HTH domain
MNINDRIKQIVETDYKSQSSLAKELGVSRVTIGSYVNNESKPNTEILEKFYDLGYNINWLISGKGTIKRHFVNENELDEYDRIAFEGYISFYT